MTRALLCLLILAVPATAQAQEAETRWSSPPLAIAGTIAGGLGLGALATSGALAATTADSAGTYAGHFFVGGSLAIVASIPMVIAGAWQVPVVVTPTSATVRLTF